MKGKTVLVVSIILLIVMSFSLALSCSSGSGTTTPAATTSSPATTQAGTQVYKLTYALFQPATAALSAANTEFAKEIEKRTNGRVQITIQPAGSLLGAPAMFDGVKNGIADMGNGITSYNPGNFPFTAIAEVPSAFQSGWVASKSMYDFLTKYQPKEFSDVHLLTAVGTGADLLSVGTSKSQVIKLEDWKGKSIRTNYADIVTALGGTVKDLPMADVFDSISKGVIDGVAGSPEPYKSWKLGDVCKYITLINVPLQPSVVWYNIMNKSKWDSLPADIQKIITEVSAEYSGKLGLVWDDQIVAGVEYCKSVGDTIAALSPDEQARWAAVISPVVDSALKKVVAKGFTQAQVDEAYNYFKSRVEHWNSQQAANNVKPLMERLQAFIK